MKYFTKYSDHCVNCFENSDLNLEKFVKSIVKNCNRNSVSLHHTLCEKEKKLSQVYIVFNLTGNCRHLHV